MNSPPRPGSCPGSRAPKFCPLPRWSGQRAHDRKQIAALPAPTSLVGPEEPEIAPARSMATASAHPPTTGLIDCRDLLRAGPGTGVVGSSPSLPAFWTSGRRRTRMKPWGVGLLRREPRRGEDVADAQDQPHTDPVVPGHPRRRRTCWRHPRHPRAESTETTVGRTPSDRQHRSGTARFRAACGQSHRPATRQLVASLAHDVAGELDGFRLPQACAHLDDTVDEVRTGVQINALVNRRAAFA